MHMQRVLWSIFNKYLKVIPDVGIALSIAMENYGLQKKWGYYVSTIINDCGFINNIKQDHDKSVCNMAKGWRTFETCL
jgi:hypothetical protein